MAAAHQGIRWDRIGRIALLFVLAFVLYLYIGPTRSWISTYKEAGKRRAEVAQLKAVNKRLKQHRDALRDPATLEREARRLGMVRAGEKSFVVQSLGAQTGG
jgi:cell division protein FtsB